MLTINSLYYVEMCHCISSISRTLIMNERGAGFCHRPFLNIMRWLCRTYFSVHFGSYSGHVCWTIPASPARSLLDHCGWYFLCVLEFSLKVFYWEFCMYVHERNCSIPFSFCYFFVWFWYPYYSSFVKRIRDCFYSFYFLD